MANGKPTPLNQIFRDGTSRHLSDSERAIKYRNAKQFVEIFLKGNLNMRKGLVREDTKSIIYKMMNILAVKNVNNKDELKEAHKILAESIKTVKSNKKAKNKKKVEEDSEMTDVEKSGMDKDEGTKGREEEDDGSDKREKDGDDMKKDDDGGGNGKKSSALDKLMAANNPRQAKRSETGEEENGEKVEMFNYKFDCRFDLITMSADDRKEELRMKYDKVMEIIRRDGVKAVLLPLKEPNGKAVTHLASRRGKITFEGDAPEQLPNLAAYGSAWLAEKGWMTVTASFHIRCSIKVYNLYMTKAKYLSKCGFEMYPKKVNMRYECNVPIAAVLPSFASLDTKALSFYFHEAHGYYINFELVKIENGKWTQCGFKDDNCCGYVIVVNGDCIAEAIRLAKLEWPFKGRKEKYALGFKMAIFPLDHNLNIHQRALETAKKENKNIIMSMHADYQHSRKKVDAGGGAVYMKFVASVESCSIPIKTKEGAVTNLREIVTKFKDPPTGKPRIANLSPMPSQEDAGSVYTNFTTHRASNGVMTTELALRSEEFIRNEMAGEIWKILPPPEARKVLASAICGKLAMEHSVTLEDIKGDDVMFPTEGVEEAQELEENSVHSEYDNATVASGITLGSEKTTNSTRVRLSETLKECDKLEEENEVLHDNIAAQEERMEAIVALLASQQLDPATAKRLKELNVCIPKEVVTKNEGNDEGSGKMSKEDGSTMDEDEDEDGRKEFSEDEVTAPAKTVADTLLELPTTKPTRFKQTAKKTTQSRSPSKESRRLTRQGKASTAQSLDSEGPITRGTSKWMAAEPG